MISPAFILALALTNALSLSTVCSLRLGNLPEQQASLQVGLRSALESQRPSKIQLSSGVQIEGQLSWVRFANERIMDLEHLESGEAGDSVAFLRFNGTTSLQYANQTIAIHGTAQRGRGLGVPLGRLKGATKDLETYTFSELEALGLGSGKVTQIEFESGIRVAGVFSAVDVRSPNNKNTFIIFTFQNATVYHGDNVILRPGVGDFEMAVGASISQIQMR